MADDQKHDGSLKESRGTSSINEILLEIDNKASGLDREARRMRAFHSSLTILTILFGVSTPALVTYSLSASNTTTFLGIVLVVFTAFATASATMRTVLRFNERYSNSALTALAIRDISIELRAKQEDIYMTVEEVFKDIKYFEVSAWARKELSKLVRGYVEKEVSAVSREKIEITAPPSTEAEQKDDQKTPSESTLSV